MQELREKITYLLYMESCIQFGPIQKQVLWVRFTDGRNIGLLSEDLIAALFNNLSKSPSSKDAYDFSDREGRKYECRTVTKRGVGLLPSKQVGTGRKYNALEHKEKRAMLHAYIFVDVRDSPLFRITMIEEKRIPDKHRLSAIDFDKLLEEIGVEERRVPVSSP